MMVLLQENEMGYIEGVCEKTPELSELSLENIKKYSDEAAIIQLKPFVESIDSAIVGSIDQYMCTELCPCHP